MFPLLNLEEVVLAQSDCRLRDVIAPCCPYVVVRPMLEFVAQITALLQRQEPHSLFLAELLFRLLWFRRRQPMREFIKRKIRHLESRRRVQSIPLLLPVLILQVDDIGIVGPFRGRVVRVNIGLHFGDFDFLTNFLFGSVVYS